MSIFQKVNSILVVGLALVLASPFVLAIEINKSPYDNRSYKYFVLENGLRAIVVSDPDAELAAAALDVDVGSLNNNPDREGMAHFLEHMLFLGTKKYPQPDEYREYIDRHGGSHGAFTSLMDTRYYFTVIPDYLPGALDRFAQFFIAPNFDADLVDRERNAVHAEYSLKYQNDMLRTYRVDGITGNPQHTFGLFSCGNNDTLGDSSGRPLVRDQLIEFYNQYYSAQRMILAMVGPQSLSELETMVHEYFSAIPTREVANNIIQELAFTPRETGLQISVKPISETSRLILNFPIPQQFQNYDNQSIGYINYIIGQSAPGGLEHALRENNWIIGMYVGNENITHKQDILHVSFELTDTGIKKIDQIVEYFYSYIDFLRKHGPSQEVFMDLKSAGEREFNYMEKESAERLVIELPYAIKHYPVKDILHANFFSNNTRYSPNKIKELLSKITLDNMRMILVDKSVHTNKTEKYYNVEYAVNNFTKQQINLWNIKKPVFNFSLPKSNPYLPNNFELYVSEDKTKQKEPINIFNDPGFKIWYMPDVRFKLPKEDIKIQITMPNAQSTPKRALLQKFLVLALKDRLQEQEQLFELAGINVDVGANQEGLILSINMFSDREEVILDALMDNIRNIKLQPKRFGVYKDLITRDLDSFKYDFPAMQAINILKGIVLNPSWVPMQLIENLQGFTLTDLEGYTTEFLQQMQIEALIHGNLSKDKAKKIFSAANNKLVINKDRESTPALPELLKLSQKADFTYIFAPSHNDSALVIYSQAEETGDQAIAKNALLARIMQGQLFDQLRTREQLAYLVDLSIFRVLERPGMVFIIQSSDKNPKYLNERFVDFTQDFAKKISGMPEEEFIQYRKSLQKILRKQAHTLGDQTRMYWEQISNHSYRFNFNEDIATELEEVSIADVSNYLNQCWLNNNSIRRVSVVSSSDDPYDNGQLIDNITKFKEVRF